MTSETRVPARQRLRPPCELLRCVEVRLVATSPLPWPDKRAAASCSQRALGGPRLPRCIPTDGMLGWCGQSSTAQAVVLLIAVVDLARDQSRRNNRLRAVTESPRVAQRAVGETPSCDPKSECRQRQKSYSLEPCLQQWRSSGTMRSHPVLGWSMGVTQGICGMVD